MKLLAVIGILLLVSIASATPINGVATDVTSNGFNVTVTGVTGTDVWIMWGDQPGYENWMTPNFTASGGTGIVQVLGAPLMGGEHVYYQACDSTGCGNELDTILSAITPMPTGTIDQFLSNITKSRFSPGVMSQSIMSAATVVVPQVVLVGISALVFIMAIWTRTKSVRLALILGLIVLPFILHPSSGLGLAIPSVGVDIAFGFACAAIAGILVAFARK